MWQLLNSIRTTFVYNIFSIVIILIFCCFRCASRADGRLSSYVSVALLWVPTRLCIVWCVCYVMLLYNTQNWLYYIRQISFNAAGTCSIRSRDFTYAVRVKWIRSDFEFNRWNFQCGLGLYAAMRCIDRL